VPTVTEVLAFEWSVDADLEAAGLFASGFRARYNQPLASTQQWDNGIFGGLQIYRGQASPDLVRIRGTFDGITDVIITGVADRNGIAFQNGVVGELAGRDLLALALDRYPTARTIPKGTNVGAAVAQLAPFPLIWNAPSYILGRDLPVTADRTVAEWIQDLLVPLRWAERHRVDTWVDGQNLYVADRMQFARGDVSLPYDRVILERMEETGLPAVDGVYVEGASYDALEAVPGAGITSTTTQDTQTTTAGNTTTIITTNTTEWKDALGRLYRRDRYVNTETFVNSILQLIVLETYYMIATFLDGAGYSVQLQGKRASETETGTKTRKDGLTAQYKTINRSWTYDAAGEQASEVTTEVSYDVETGTQGEHVLTKYAFTRAGGQVNRIWDVQQTDATSGEVKRRTGQSEVGAGSLPTASLAPVPAGFQRVTKHYHSSGAATLHRRESSDLLGSDADCNTIAALIWEDYLYKKVRVILRFPPALDVKPGKRLTVTGAPSYWKSNVFYVLSSSASKTGKGAEQRIEGIAWI